tara:strand:- start:5478 stop:6278 length:801 start_codon:yes stop_codon:yes gene_type:complete
LLKKIFLAHLLKRIIPNTFTALNLITGCFATYFAFNGAFEVVFFLVLLGTFFDLFDGLLSRLLKVENNFGIQFDSMADLITCGMVPGIVMYNLIARTNFQERNLIFKLLENEFSMSFVPLGFAGFFITLATSIRLAKFNIDMDNKTEFKGLPAPVNALFIVSLPLFIENLFLMDFRYLIESENTFLVIIIISCILMNNNLPFFSLKSISFKIESLKIIVFLLLSISLFSVLCFAAFPIIILIYILINLLGYTYVNFRLSFRKKVKN